MNHPVIYARCEQTKPDAGNIKVFTLRALDAHVDFLNSLQPGRHVAIEYPNSSGIMLQRFYSITRKTNPDTFELAIKRSGNCGVSDHLHSSLQEGSLISLLNVTGDISVSSIIGYKHVGMIAGGIGLTLPIALLRELMDRSRLGKFVPNVVLFLCIPRISEIPFLHELLEMDLTTPWFTFHAFITQENVKSNEHFLYGRPSVVSLKTMGQPQAVVICGSHSFAQAFRDKTTMIFPSADLLIESFTPPAVMPSFENKQGSPAQLLKIRMTDSDRIIETSPGRSLLEILESSEIPIRSQCRTGICGTCRVKISDGECRFDADFCLSDSDKDKGYALACCTFPLSGNIEVNLNPDA